MSKIPLLGSAPRPQRSRSFIQLHVDDEDACASTPVFHYKTSDFIYELNDKSNDSSNDVASLGESNRKGSSIKLKDLLMARWEDSKKGNVFNYDLNCLYKFLPGDFDFSLQLNVERGRLRRHPMRFRSIREPFNCLRWNFTKLKQKEILMYLRCDDRPCSEDPLDRHVIAVNASPLEIGHSLIIPAINRCIPQIMNEMSVRVSIDVMLLIDDDRFHVLYNSLLGQASVNHLHMHAIFWPYDSELINKKCERILPDVYVIRRPTWFIHTIVFQLSSQDELENFQCNITKCLDFLSDKNVAHNVFFSRAPPLQVIGEESDTSKYSEKSSLVTAYIFPRISILGAKPTSKFSAAALELAGCLTAYSIRFFETATEEIVLRTMEEEATLPDSQFNRLLTELGDEMSGKTHRRKSVKRNSAAELSSSELDELRDSFQTFESLSPRRFFGNERQGRTSSFDTALSFSFLNLDK